MNNSKYHYIAVTKLKALLAKFFSKHDWNRFCINCFGNFQADEKLTNIKSHVKIIMMLNWNYLKKFLKNIK